MDEKLDYFIRQRATLRRQITLQQRSASPDAAKIAVYQRRRWGCPPPTSTQLKAVTRRGWCHVWRARKPDRHCGKPHLGFLFGR
jgi:hypothetical protein